MKGLILKDFYSLKVYVKTLLVMVVIYALLGIFTDSPSMLSGLIGVFCMILPVTSFSYDKYFKWEEFALSLPLRRTKISRLKRKGWTRGKPSAPGRAFSMKRRFRAACISSGATADVTT